jgi:hypothetical protein
MTMKFSQQARAGFGLGFYTAGIALGLVLALFLTWADFEAAFFDSALKADQEMRNFSCPLAITSHETAQITAKISNPSERPLKTVLRLAQTEGSVIAIKRLEERLEFSPGQTLQFSWPVQASDAAWGRFVMARVYSLASSPLPSMANYCGILLINFPFLTGHQFIALLVVLALALVTIGGRMWAANTPQTSLVAEKNSRLMLAYVILVAITLILSILTGWAIAGLVLVVNVVLAMVILAYRASHS